MWKEKYLELMFSDNLKKLNSHEGIKLKVLNIPQSLFKYRKIDEFSLSNLANDSAWFRKATSFNDPYDSNLTINSIELNDNFKEGIINIAESFNCPLVEIEDLNAKEAISHIYSGNYPEKLKGSIERVLKEMNQIFEEYTYGISNMIQENVFASCFSEDPTSMLMWSHYADSHKGMVFEYNFKSLDSLDSKDKIEILSGLHPVYYTTELMNLDNYRTVQDKISVPTLASINKSPEWKYEKEWRIVILNRTDDIGFNFPIVKPSSIILGARVEKEDKIRLSLEAMKRGIPLKQIKLDNSKFHLEIVEFDGVF